VKEKYSDFEQGIQGRGACEMLLMVNPALFWFRNNIEESLKGSLEGPIREMTRERNGEQARIGKHTITTDCDWAVNVLDVIFLG